MFTFILKVPKYSKLLSLSAVAGVGLNTSVGKRKIVKMQEGYVTINKVPTHIYTWGKWIENDKFDEQTKEMVLIVTGNPGELLKTYFTQYTKICFRSSWFLHDFL